MREGTEALIPGGGGKAETGKRGAGPFVLPGKPPTPPPRALLGKADGRKNPIGHPSGRQSGPFSRRGAGKFDH